MEHPDYLLPRLTSRQLAEWIAYFNLCPFGQDVSDYQRAQIGSELTNRWRGKGEKAKDPEDFLPLYSRPEQTPEEMRDILRGILAGVGHGNR